MKTRDFGREFPREKYPPLRDWGHDRLRRKYPPYETGDRVRDVGLGFFYEGIFVKVFLRIKGFLQPLRRVKLFYVNVLRFPPKDFPRFFTLWGLT